MEQICRSNLWTAQPAKLFDWLTGIQGPRGLRTASSVSSSCCFCTRCLAKGMVCVLNCVQRCKGWGKRKVISYNISSSCEFGSVAGNVGQAAMQAVLAGIAVVWTSDTHPPHFSSAAAFTSKNSISIHVVLSLVSEKVAAAYKTASPLRSLPHNDSFTSLLLHLQSSQLGMPGRNPI